MIFPKSISAILSPTFALALLAFASTCAAHAASLPFADLANVRGPYDGVGANGEAMHVCRLGDAGAWPICAYWSSSRLEHSPLLGIGWSVPALESRFVQLDERRWAFHQPDGFVRIFVKPERGDGKTLTGGPAWTAKLEGDAVRIVADMKDSPAKSEFFFRQGRLLHMSCEEGDFEIRYAGRVAECILSHGKPLLEIVRVSSPEPKIDFSFNGGKSHAWAVCRQTSVFGAPGDSYAPLPTQERCLVGLTWSDGRKAEFSYGGANGEAFFTADDVRLVWDPASRRAIACGGWRFIIGEPKSEGDGPSFLRRNEDGREESYSSNRRTGLRREEFLDGSTRECKMFTSGPLAWRRMRWLKERNPAGVLTTTNFSYDEEGNIVYKRIEREGVGYVEGWYGKDGNLFRRRANGKKVYTQ